MDRDLEGDGVLMCQPMGATCASHDAGQRPAHPGSRVGSLNAARYTPPYRSRRPAHPGGCVGSLNAARCTPPTGVGGPRTQVAAWGRSTRPAARRLYRGQRPAHLGGRVGSLNAARYTPPTGAGGPRTQVAAWGRSTQPATRRLPGPEARVPRWLRGVAQRGLLHAAYRGRRPAYPGSRNGTRI